MVFHPRAQLEAIRPNSERLLALESSGRVAGVIVTLRLAQCSSGVLSPRSSWTSWQSSLLLTQRFDKSCKLNNCPGLAPMTKKTSSLATSRHGMGSQRFVYCLLIPKKLLWKRILLWTLWNQVKNPRGASKQLVTSRTKISLQENKCSHPIIPYKHLPPRCDILNSTKLMVVAHILSMFMTVVNFSLTARKG